MYLSEVVVVGGGGGGSGNSGNSGDKGNSGGSGGSSVVKNALNFDIDYIEFAAVIVAFLNIFPNLDCSRVVFIYNFGI